MPTQSVTGVEPRRKGSQHPLHAFDQRRFRRLDHHVKGIAHQTKGVDLPAGIDSSFSQDLDESLSVAVVQDDILPRSPRKMSAANRASEFPTTPQLPGAAAAGCSAWFGSISCVFLASSSP